jgi:DNA-directed RNA polymerase specialized sigma24 family protein
MREVAAQIEQLHARQRELLTAGKQEGLEVSAMARALGISRQTAYGWLDD